MSDRAPESNPAADGPCSWAGQVARIADRLRSAARVVAITGAGVSAESRIPTYRDKLEGLWASFDFRTLATPEAFAADPETVSRWYDFRRTKCLEAEPNPGHLALAAMERLMASRGGRFTLLTQNVDRLHQRAGSTSVVELHGNIIEWRCVRSGRKYADLPVPLPELPMRSADGGLLRPDVVWFGETLPAAAVEAAFDACSSCELFLSIGTSAVVYPAAGFVEIARRAGAMTVEINRDPTPISSAVDESIHGLAGQVLPALVEAAFGVG